MHYYAYKEPNGRNVRCCHYRLVVHAPNLYSYYITTWRIRSLNWGDSSVAKVCFKGWGQDRSAVVILSPRKKVDEGAVATPCQHSVNIHTFYMPTRFLWDSNEN